MGAEAMPDAMTENLTPHDAARALAQAAKWEDALVARTEGLTWMLWGLATPATFLTYAFAAVLAELEGLRLGWLWSVLWVPWIAAGVAGTVTLWRSAALAIPRLHDPRETRRAVLWSAAFSLGLFAAFLLLDPDSAVVPLGGIGAMWTLMGILDPWGATRRGRRVTLAVGGTLVAVALLLALGGVGEAASGMAGIVVSGVVPFSAGLWLALRG